MQSFANLQRFQRASKDLAQCFFVLLCRASFLYFYIPLTVVLKYLLELCFHFFYPLPENYLAPMSSRKCEI